MILFSKHHENSPQEKSLKNPGFKSSANKEEERLARLFGHMSEEEGNSAPSELNRALSEQFTSVDKETLRETVRPDTPHSTVPCSWLLGFLQRNSIIATGLATGILVATGLLLLMLTIYIKKKQASSPSTNMTYNIFIINRKTWWQKSQEKNSRKYAGKQKQLDFSSSV
ncbi:uncharacterized protein C2orf92 homolog [Saccopteryx bilineata]|uniref:uncharacterized protein C2orf92 homolog n=1 Tax=Saccopteryx bilineata TaxID=59482 RepID=UPI00338DDFDA